MRTSIKQAQFQHIIVSDLAIRMVQSIMLMAKKPFAAFQNSFRQNRRFYSYKEQKEYEIKVELLRAKFPYQF